MKDLQLFHPESGKMYTIQVSDENFAEVVVNNNIGLATTLLEERLNFLAAYKLVKEDAGVSSCVSDSQSNGKEHLENTEESSMENNEDSELENCKLWTSASTKYLISLCKKYDKEFQKGVKKYVWNKVATQLKDKFLINYTSQQCDTKFKVLKNMYKQIKKHNEQSGNNIKTWEYYDLMEDILFDKPEICATATCSSSKGLVLRENLPTSTSGTTPETPKHSDEHRSDEEENLTPKFKSTFLKKRQRTENVVEKRHREKMARQDRYLDLLERMTTSLEKVSNSK